MKRRDFSALLATAPLAGATGAAFAQGGPVDGKHYQTLGQPLPTTPGKVEVIEFFWYGCPHCYAFEPAIEAWHKQLPADVVFRKAHVAFRANIKAHQRMFYALESLGKEAQVRPAIFTAMHQQGLTLEDAPSQAKFLGTLGVDPAKYQEAYNSFGVVTKCTQAEKLSEAFRIDGVPSIGVGGRFLTSPSMASGGQRMTELELGQKALQITDFLIQRVRSKSMKRRDATAALVAATLAPAAFAQVGPVEGKHYARLSQTLPGTPGKIEVVEFFFYRCPHCYAFDPLLEAWAHQLPADVSFRRVPVGANKLLQLHQRMFYTLQAMNALSPAVHSGIFNAIHRGGAELEDEAAVVALVGQLGVDTAKFKQTLHSFAIEPKLTQGAKLAEMAGVESVPALVIGGRYRTGPSMAGAPGASEAVQGQQALAVADFLIKLSRGKG